MANNIRAAVGRSHQVMASAARTATPDTEELEVPAGARFMMLVIDVTAVSSTPSTTFKIEGVDRVAGKVFPTTAGGLLSSAALAATGVTTLRVGPGLTAAANVTANDVLPPVVRITATHGNANSMTYSVSAHFC